MRPPTASPFQIEAAHIVERLHHQGRLGSGLRPDDQGAASPEGRLRGSLSDPVGAAGEGVAGQH